MKPIEPGCMAWVHGLKVNTEWNGKVVTIKERTRLEKIINCWPIKEGNAAFKEKNLLRIDGYEDDKSIEEITKELTI